MTLPLGLLKVYLMMLKIHHCRQLQLAELVTLQGDELCIQTNQLWLVSTLIETVAVNTSSTVPGNARSCIQKYFEHSIKHMKIQNIQMKFTIKNYDHQQFTLHVL